MPLLYSQSTTSALKVLFIAAFHYLHVAPGMYGGYQQMWTYQAGDPKVANDCEKTTAKSMFKDVRAQQVWITLLKKKQRENQKRNGASENVWSGSNLNKQTNEQQQQQQGKASGTFPPLDKRQSKAWVIWSYLSRQAFMQGKVSFRCASGCPAFNFPRNHNRVFFGTARPRGYFRKCRA